MIINFDNAQLDLQTNDDSYRYRAIRGENALTLRFNSTDFIDIPVGAWAEYLGDKYELMSPENFKKNGTRKFEYTLILESEQSKLKKYKFKDPTTKKLKFSLTDTPQMHIQFLVDNLNMRESGWTVGETIDAVEQVINYNHTNCFEALNMIADAFNTEWEVSGKIIHLRKVEYNKETPLSLSYGKGNGFKPGVGRMNANDSNPVEILYTQGGTRNIDRSTYGNDELLLPKSQQLEYEGRKYVVDDEGYSMRRADKELTTKVEDSLDCSHIYPSRIGTISEVIVISSPTADDPANKFYDFKDSSIPADLDYSKYVIKGEKATIIFQDGMLAGKEFDLETDDKGNLIGYVHSERRFKLVQQELDGMKMPNDGFAPVVGGKYIVFGVSMPQSYISDNATQSGAEWDMFKEGAKYLYEHEDPRFTFTGELDGIWAKKNWPEIGGKIRLGSYVLFSDGQFQPEGVLIRMTGIKEFLNDPHSPTIELSNVSVGASFSSELKKIDSNEVLNEDRFNGAIQFTKRSWRDVMETMAMMFDPEGDYFTELIKPLVVHTAQLIVGTNSQQMDFRGVKFIPNANGDPNVFKNTGGYLEHFTINTNGTVRTWTISSGTHTLYNSYAYYVYARCPKYGDYGEIFVTTQKIQLEAVSGYYHFWVGILNTPEDGVRSWQPNYGFTEIAGQQITTGVIKDRLTRMIIDLTEGTIYGKIKFASGTEGYNNIKDRPDLTEWSNTITNNAVNSSNTNAQKFVNTASEDLAEKLGYTSYSAMADAATAGKTIIEGGFLRTSLIQAEAIIAKYVTAAFIAALEITTSKLTVTSGAKIGNFNISGGWLTVNKSSSDGAGYIDIRGGSNRTAFGYDLIPKSAGGGVTQTAVIENNNLADFGGETVALELKAIGKDADGVKGTALILRGGLRAKGAMSIAEKTYALNSFTKASDASPLLTYNTFIFQPSSNTNAVLPTAAAIEAAFGGFGDGTNVVDRGFIRIKILCTRYSNAQVWVVPGNSNTPLLNGGGNQISEIKIGKGNFLELAYHNRAWYLLNHSS